MNWKARRERIGEVLREHRLDGMIVSHPPNVRYLTGFSGTSGMVVVAPETMVLLTDFRYREQAAEETAGRAQVEIVAGDPWLPACRWIEDLGIMAVGFESHTTAVVEADRIRGGSGNWLVVPVAGVVESLRAVKDPDEVAALRRAVSVATDALDAVLRGKLVAGRRELDVAADLELELRVRGSEWHPFPTIVASGPRTALPHAGTSQREIESGDLVLLDFGATVDGYCSDLTRTVVVGRADDRQREVYGVVRTAQRRACAEVRAGITGCAADGLARSVIDSAGYGDCFGHSLGHGIGLEVHEAPRLAQTNPDPLPSHSVVTVEPGVYLAGWGGVRIEDDVYLCDCAPEILSHYSTELIEIH